MDMDSSPIARHTFRPNPPTRMHPAGSDQRMQRCRTAVLEMEPPETHLELEGSTLCGFGLPVSAHEHLDIWMSTPVTSPIEGHAKPSEIHLVYQINHLAENIAHALRPKIKIAGLSMLGQGFGNFLLVR